MSGQAATTEDGDELYEQSPNVRIEQTINADWTFNYFPSRERDDQKASVAYDDGTWPAVALPHTWSTYETTGEVHPFILNASERDDPYWWYGWGWYRKRFVVGDSLQDKKVFVEFDGVQKYSRVYLNGTFVGDHKGGYTSFSFDLSDHVRFGEENVLAVAVSNRRDDHFGGIPPMTAGNFNVYGGIYRDARLVIKDKMHIPFQGSARHEGGTFVTTPEVDSTHGIVNVKTYVKNDYSDAREALLQTLMVDPDGKVVATMESTHQISPGTITEFDQTSPSIPAPELWSPASPNLYTVVSKVRMNGRVVDVYESPLGFRWFHWDYETDRLYVNGKKIHIHGTNRHQDYPWLGDALPKWLHVQEMKDIRHHLGHNFMRTAHYPQDPLIYDLTDQLGIITAEELPNIKSIDFGEDIQRQNVREMIRRDRNHPSIFFWSMGNETNDPANGDWAWEEDTTRILHGRKAEGAGERVNHTHHNLDMENLLRVTIRGWYNRDVKDLRPENTPETPKSGQHAGTEEWQHIQSRVQDASIRGRIDENTVVWLYADHGADREYKNAPLKHVNPKGWLDLYRIPKYMYYLWQANYSEELMVFIHPHFWRSQYLGQQKDMVVDSNGEDVELFVNGESLGTRHPSADNFYTVTFEDVNVEEGAITAQAVDGGDTVRTSVTMAGPPARIVLKPSHDTITANRAGLSIVTAYVVDDDSVRVYGATNALTWEVAGPGTLVGPSVYTSDIDDHETMAGSMYIDAPVKNIVRSTDTSGTITLRVSSPGLKPGVVRIQSEPSPARSSPGIEELPLTDAGRTSIERDTSFTHMTRTVEIHGLEPIRENYEIPGATPEALQSQVSRFIRTRNPDVDTSSVAFKTLLEHLGDYLQRMDGDLIADDYNVYVRQFNDALRLSASIRESVLHPHFKDALYTYYADRLIKQGATLDVEAERERLASIVDGSRVVVIHDDPAEERDIYYNNAGDFYRARAQNIEHLLTLVFPDFAAFSEGQKREAYKYIEEINPHITRAGVPDNTSIKQAYALASEQPILIPSLEILRHL